MQTAQKAAGFSTLTILLIIIALVGGGLMGYLNASIVASQYRSELSERAAILAAALDVEKIKQLNTSAKLYPEIHAKLAVLKQNSSDTRSIYVAGLKQGAVYILADSEQPGSPYFAPPGEAYAKATSLQLGLFSQTQPAVEGPLSDKTGSWLTGLAPIVDLTSGQVIGLVGIEVNAATFTQISLQAALIPTLVATTFIVLVAFYEWSRRRQQTLLRMRSELVSIASHELRTPVTGMRWAAETLLHTVQEGPQRTMVQAMYDSIMNLQAGTEDILQLSRLQRNPKLTLADTDITALVKEVCAMQDLAAKQKQVTIIMDDSWPASLMLRCDAAKMKRALHNLISNAVKYTRENTKVMVQYEVAPKHHRIIVADQGIGIPKEEQSRVFEGFYRASNAKASGASGTGLGLYLIQTIMQQHHGSVGFTSEENKGTTFVLTLPKK